MCHEHPPPEGGLKINSLDSIKKLHGLVLSNRCHVASEVLVIMVQRYADNDYTAIPLLVIPSCKSMPATLQVSILTVFMDVWQTYVEKGVLGPLLNMDSDGQGQRRQAFNTLFTSVSADSSPPESLTGRLYIVLRRCRLLDLVCGPRAMTGAFDLKHIWKRFRTLFVSTARGLEILGDSVKRNDLIVMFRASGHNEAAISAMFNPVDKQNVPIACQLLEGLRDLDENLGAAYATDHPIRVPQIQRAKLVGAAMDGLLAPITGLDRSISDLLVQISTSAHILFVLFRADATKCVQIYLIYSYIINQ
jgi:hypothetical protein